MQFTLSTNSEYNTAPKHKKSHPRVETTQNSFSLIDLSISICCNYVSSSKQK